MKYEDFKSKVLKEESDLDGAIYSKEQKVDKLFKEKDDLEKKVKQYENDPLVYRLLMGEKLKKDKEVGYLTKKELKEVKKLKDKKLKNDKLYKNIKKDKFDKDFLEEVLNYFYQSA